MGKLFLLMIGAMVLWRIFGAYRFLPILRKISGLTVFEEAVGRSAELGRPVLFCTGAGGIDATLLGALPILNYVAGLCARMGMPLLVPVCDPPTYPMEEEIVRQAFLAEGQEALYSPENVRYLSNNQNAFAAGTAGWILRERVGATFLLGYYGYESLIIAEAGQRVGAFQIGGAPQYYQIPFFIATCDYTLIGEEFFAASAYLASEPQMVGSLVGQDWTKFALLVLILLGTLASTLQSFLLS